MTGAILGQAWMQGVNLTDTNLTGANMLGVYIFEAIWCRTITSGGLKGDC